MDAPPAGAIIQSVKLGDNTIIFNESQAKIFTEVFNPASTKREFAFFGAVRAGKSYLYQLIGLILCCRNKKLKGLWVRDTYLQLKDSVIKQFCDDFGRQGVFTYKKTDREAEFFNGSVIKFRAFDVDGVGILSTEYDFIVFCQAEDISEQWFLLALSRLSGKGLKAPLMFCEGNPANTWVRRRYKDKSRRELAELGIMFVEVKTAENERNLPANYVDFLLKNYPETWFNRYVMGGWEQIDEMVFSSFRQSEHVIEICDPKFYKTYKKVIGMDYGWRNPSAMVWLAVDYDGCIIIFDEFKRAEQIATQLADANARHNGISGPLVTVCDYSIKRPDRDGRSLWDDLLRAGLRLTESNKNESANLALLNQLFRQNRIGITRNCHELIKELLNYKWKALRIGTDANFSETPVDKDNHLIDALLYAVAYMELQKSVDPLSIAESKSIKALTVKLPTISVNDIG